MFRRRKQIVNKGMRTALLVVVAFISVTTVKVNGSTGESNTRDTKVSIPEADISFSVPNTLNVVLTRENAKDNTDTIALIGFDTPEAFVQSMKEENEYMYAVSFSLGQELLFRYDKSEAAQKDTFNNMSDETLLNNYKELFNSTNLAENIGTTLEEINFITYTTSSGDKYAGYETTIPIGEVYVPCTILSTARNGDVYSFYYRNFSSDIFLTRNLEQVLDGVQYYKSVPLGYDNGDVAVASFEFFSKIARYWWVALIIAGLYALVRMKRKDSKSEAERGRTSKIPTQDSDTADNSAVNKDIAIQKTTQTQPAIEVERKSNSIVCFCRKCGKRIPEDSEFCNYCGTAVIVVNDTKKQPKTKKQNTGSAFGNNLSKKDKEAFLNLLVAQTIHETIGEPTEKFVLYSPDSDDYGLCATNPILVHGREDQKELIKKLKTEDGKSIAWNRIGSTSTDGVPGTTDIFVGSINGKEHIRVYVNFYCNTNHAKAPKGLLLQ